MDTERIERALREGPPDEPVYVPGGHRDPRRRLWSLARVAAVLSTAVVIGVMIGVSLSVLREPSGLGGAVDVRVLAAELEGAWESNEITAVSWRAELIALGHRREDVDAALARATPHDRVRYRMVFADDHVQIFGSFDGSEWDPLSGGPYELQADGSLIYDDIACFITASVAIDGGLLSFSPIETRSCNAEETLNNVAFFNLVDYARD